MVVRYMGTKRHMAGHVRSAVEELNVDGRLVDLFSGMGSVAESLQGTTSVVTNDAMAFTGAISRARFTAQPKRSTPDEVVSRLHPDFADVRHALRSEYADQLNAESAAIRGGRKALTSYMNEATHVGNSLKKRTEANRAAAATGPLRYKLASLYFANGYLSLAQAIEVDALRAAIDTDPVTAERDWLLGAWISALSVLINAPGHTAQYLRPNTDSAHSRISRTWSRSVFDQFPEALYRLRPVGNYRWRRSNSSHTADALDLVEERTVRRVGAVYADPPYTKDQYSRFYHLYETLYLYDFPDSKGNARSRTDRFETGFCRKTAVAACFQDLCRNVARMKVPLIISYPANGLLTELGFTVDEIAMQHFSSVTKRAIQAQHSTMGASSGNSKKPATENLYVCK